MFIKSVILRVISAPLKQPFVTALGTISEREAIIVEVQDQHGLSGWGEVVAFSSPWYTEETIQTCFYMLKEFLIPSINKQITHPTQLQWVFEQIRGHHMAKSGLECAFWDLYSKQQGMSLSKLYGGTREEVDSGVVIASNDVSKALAQIEGFLEEGYKRYKIKIHPHHALSTIKDIRRVYPDLPLMVDANSSFQLEEDLIVLKQLDEYQLMMIEQPLAHDDLLQHRELQKQIQTPICLDESITSEQAAKNAVALESCRIISVKMGRVSGPSKAIAIHNHCLQYGIQLWCGGMIEFGISKAHNIALSSLSGFTIPGDISSSARFWEEDIIEPRIVVANDQVKVPNGLGIGYEIQKKIIRKLQTHKETFII